MTEVKGVTYLLVGEVMTKWNKNDLNKVDSNINDILRGGRNLWVKARGTRL